MVKSSIIVEEPIFANHYHSGGIKFEKKCNLEIVIFYTEILTGKVVLWCFSSSEASEKIHNSTFLMRWESDQDITPTFP